MARLRSELLADGSVLPTTRCGSIEIKEYVNHKNVIVTFLDTGYVGRFYASKVIDGQIKDPLAPLLCGVGYMGVGKYRSKENNIPTRYYCVWKGIISRCYSDARQKKQPTYKGCTVCDEWHNFQNFAKWFIDNYIDGYHLDKDIKVDGNKIYGPGTCLFVSQSENSTKANAKEYKFKNPKGKVVEIYNLKLFCIKNKLDQPTMCNVYNGNKKQHKGWVKYNG